MMKPKLGWERAEIYGYAKLQKLERLDLSLIDVQKMEMRSISVCVLE